MRLAHTHARAQANARRELPPGNFETDAAGYFPDSRVASHGEYVSPLSFSSRSGSPIPSPLEAFKLPRGGESPWIVPAQSDEQGLGRSPGQAWPWQVISEAYNFDQLAIMPFEWEQAIVGGFPGGWDGRNPPERAATFGQVKGAPVYYEQSEGYATSDMDQIAVTADPQSAAYTIGWGALGADPAAGFEDYGY